ncbi:MAG TPA: hypothetical protein DDW81_07240 [Cryomorphaceae bacterium]|nr:hypothetical protein [Cryomorphaceae bacterium]
MYAKVKDDGPNISLFFGNDPKWILLSFLDNATPVLNEFTGRPGRRYATFISKVRSFEANGQHFCVQKSCLFTSKDRSFGRLALNNWNTINCKDDPALLRAQGKFSGLRTITELILSAQAPLNVKIYTFSIQSSFKKALYSCSLFV